MSKPKVLSEDDLLIIEAVEIDGKTPAAAGRTLGIPAKRVRRRLAFVEGCIKLTLPKLDEMSPEDRVKMYRHVHENAEAA